MTDMKLQVTLSGSPKILLLWLPLLGYLGFSKHPPACRAASDKKDGKTEFGRLIYCREIPFTTERGVRRV